MEQEPREPQYGTIDTTRWDLSETYQMNPQDDLSMADIIRLIRAIGVHVTLPKSTWAKCGELMRHFKKEGQ